MSVTRIGSAANGVPHSAVCGESACGTSVATAGDVIPGPLSRSFALLAALALARAGTGEAQAPALWRLAPPDGGLDARRDSLLRAAGTPPLHRLPDGAYLLADEPPGGVGAARPLRLPAAEAPATPPRRLGFHAATPAGTPVLVDLVLAFPTARAHLRDALATAGFAPAGLHVEGGVTLRGRLPHDRLPALVAHPLVLGAEAVDPRDEPAPYNYEARGTHAVGWLNAGIPGAPHLDGAGVVIGLGDGGALGGHPDLGDRVVHSTTDYALDWGDHPDMVAGVLAGAGVVDPRHRGAAAEAELVVESAAAITARAPSLHAAYGMTITNNSYGPSFRCATAGRYAASSATIDQQLLDHPALLHVYAAGNHGRQDCDEAPAPGYGTLPGGAQTAKNALTVGNVGLDRRRYPTSAAGPTRDGRLKPDLVAVGEAVTTPDRDGGYARGTGTSYAAPGVAGALALLTQRYRQLHAGTDPGGALLKAVTCATATDLGPAGPDYRYGFGMLDARRALAVLEAGSYARGTARQGAAATHVVSVPAGATRLSALLYYHDQAASPFAREPRRLVTDLDLALVTPAGDSLAPWTLDPAAPGAAATRTRDAANNAELVTLDDPPPGTYALVVGGRELPYGARDYVLAWDVRRPGVTLTCPHGGESLRPGASTFVAWDAAPGVGGPWRVEARRPGGAWEPVASGLPDAERSMRYTPPAEPGPLELRVVSESTQLADATDLPVELIAPPLALAGAPYCAGGVRLTWEPTPGAVAYEVYAYDGDAMTRVARPSHPGAVVAAGASPEGLYSVSAVAASGSVSARAYAIAQGEAGDPSTDCLAAEPPVRWGGLDVDDLGGDAGLRVSWRVDSERENAYFELLRVEGPTHGDTVAAYRVVARATGRGTALSPATYHADDPTAPALGEVRYRVRQVSNAGAAGYSPTVRHARLAGGEGVTTATRPPAADAGGPSVALAQNPVVAGALRLRSARPEPLAAHLLDPAGRRVATIGVPPGESVAALPPGLAPGIYALRLPATGQVLRLAVE